MIEPVSSPFAGDPRAALQRLFGYPDFRPGQEEVIRAVLAGEDVLAVMPTGAGKSLCYQLPAMLLDGCTVVISPLVALMKDQLDSLPAALRNRAAVFNSAVERDELDAGLAELAAGRLKLVYVAPERLRQRPFLHALARARIGRLVVDEAHCVSLWGHDFRPDYLFIPAVMMTLGEPPVLAMTATATPVLQAELRQRFGRPLRVVHTGVLRPNLSLEVEEPANEEEKLRRLIDLCTDEPGAGIVYVGSRQKAEEVASILYRRGGISARHYHAGMDKDERAAVQDQFMRGRTRVIVATIAFGMGVDKPDVRFIVHFHPSRSLEAYAQESGRAGRDGKPARCILFWTPTYRATLRRRARDDALSPDLLRAVYRAVRRGTRGRFAWWPTEQLAAVVAGEPNHPGEVDETDLEQAGVLRRHCDLPETMRVVPLSQPSVPSAECGAGDPAPSSAGPASPPRRAGVRKPHSAIAALGLEPGRRASLDPFEAAAALGCPPHEVEAWLLGARDAGLLGYQGVGRGWLLELLPHPPDLAERLRGLIDGHREAQRRRAEEMIGYAAGRRCRAAVIARHFGVAHPGRCDHCDVCRTPPSPSPSPACGRGEPFSPSSTVGRGGRGVRAGAGRGATSGASRGAGHPPPPDRAPEDIILECVAELPFPMGRTGITNLLKGSVKSAVEEDRSRHFGALAALSGGEIAREIDRLVEADYLARAERRHPRDGRTYHVLSVTPAGFAKPPAPWPPTRPERGTRRPESGLRPESGTPDDGFSEDSPAVEERFARLRAWRTRVAREAVLPAYTIFHDATLRLLAGARVASLDDLARIKGVGPAKLERYGAALLELLRDGDVDG
jgi:ATP-dependent DNA helicase RecQ